MSADDQSYGNVGIPMEGVLMKLVDWPEGGYLTMDKPNPRGELMVGGAGVADGYYKAPDATADAFLTDTSGQRWFRTGDVVEVLPDGRFRIIDRKKDLTKLSNGEYISLGKIESALKSCKLVDNICVVTDSDSNCVMALVTPNTKALLSLAKQLSLPDSYSWDELCADPSLTDHVLQSIRQTSALSGLNRCEIPVKIKLCPEEWTADNHMITAAFKLKRNNVLSYYQSDVNEMFANN
ncbi:unnamed protein product, partial [Medioppia subpectinata]